MNCKPGDLAVVVGGDLPQNLGRLCTVVRLTNTEDSELIKLEGEEWVISPATVLAGYNAAGLVVEDGDEVFAFDSHLRPIRDNDGEDEILRIAGKPIKETA